MISLFFQLHQIDQDGSRFTAMEREMLRLTLEANPGVTLGAAVQDVFDYLKIKLKKERLEAICNRLAEESRQRQPEAEEERVAPRQQKGAAFGKELIEWIEGMHAAERLLSAVGYNATLARQIYCEQDYLVTDNISSLFLKDRWNQSLIMLQAAAAPWTGGSKGGDHEVVDLSQAADDDPAWKELEKLFGPH